MHASVTKQYNLIPTKGVLSLAGKVTAAWWKVTAAYHRVYNYVTCGLTAKKPGSAPCPTLVIEYGTSFYRHMPIDLVGTYRLLLFCLSVCVCPHDFW